MALLAPCLAEGGKELAKKVGGEAGAAEKALEADLAFRAELAALVEEIKAKGGDQIMQSASVTGDQNVTTQIAFDDDAAVFPGQEGVMD